MIAVVVSLAVVGLLLLGLGLNPIRAYAAIFRGAFGTPYARVETMVKMAPLLLAALGVTVAYRSRLWNIGAEGQLYMGAVFAAGVAIYVGPLPVWIHLPLTILTAFVGGAAWALVPALLRATLGVSEVIVTVMMNSIAIQVVSYLVNGPWKDPAAVEPYTRKFPLSASLPIIIERTRLHAGFLIAIVAVFAVYALMNHTVIGYQVRAAGLSFKAARYAGIKVKRTIIISMLISGGLAGLAGLGESAGVWRRLMLDLSPGYGYTAIVIALLGQLNAWGVLAASFLFAGLVVGADSMQRTVGAPAAVVLIVQALVVLSALASDYFGRRSRNL